MLKHILLQSLLVVSPFAGAPTKEENKEIPFVQVYEKNSITLHERPIVNRFGEEVREVKALFLANSPIESVVEILRNTSHGIKWNLGACAYEVHHEQAESWITYIEYDLPWPLNNHDAVLMHQLFVDDTKIEVSLESVEEVIATKDGVDRMEQVQGKWTARQLAPNLVEISYQVSAKPSPVPRFITDPIVHYQMVRSMSALRQLLEEVDS